MSDAWPCPPWPYMHAAYVARRLLGVPRKEVFEHLPADIRRMQVDDGNGGKVWVLHAVDVAKHLGMPPYEVPNNPFKREGKMLRPDDQIHVWTGDIVISEGIE